MVCSRALFLAVAAAATIAWSCGGCDRHTHGSGGHSHDSGGHAHGAGGHAHGGDDEKTVQITVADARVELFLEHPLPVAGSAVRFVTHVSDVVTGEPRREGMVQFVGRGPGGGGFEVTAAVPARDGIYLPQLTFDRAGEWSLVVKIPQILGEHTVQLPPVRVFASAAEAAAAPDPDAPEGISFLKEQQWKIRLLARPAGKRSLVERLRAAGTVKAAPGRRAGVSAPVGGRLLAPPAGALPGVGERVEAGQLLALVQPPVAGADWLAIAGNRAQQLSLEQQVEATRLQVQALQAELAVKIAEARAGTIRSEAAVRKAERALARVRELHAQQAKSDRDLEGAEFELLAAQAERQASESLATACERAIAELGKSGPAPASDVAAEGVRDFPAVELRAPIAGIVTQVGAALGEFVTPETAIARIVDPSVVHLEARVFETDLPRVGPGRDAQYEIPARRGATHAILGMGGRFVYLGPEVDPHNRTVPIVYELPNPAGALAIGMAIDLHVETTRVEEGIAVPESALVEEDGRWVVFVQAGGETFEKRDVQVGIRDTGFVHLLSGVAANERVVVSGAYAVRLASVATTIPAHGHSH